MTKKFDRTLMWIWPIVASVITHFAKTSIVTSTILFLVLPGIYISFKNRKFIKKGIMVAITTLPILVVTDYIAVTTGTWFFPTSIFPHRLFGIVTFEVLFWYVSWVYFITIFYEYFLDEHCTHKLSSPRLKYVFFAFLSVFIIFLATLSATGTFLKIPYFYITFGIVFAVIPIISVLLKFPNLFTKFAEATVYFAFMSFLWEIVAVPLEQWTFPGTLFIGWVNVLGARFPFEEFLVWILLGAASILSWYEFFDDDQK